ncbi:MAG: hypothetical protein JWP82_2983, partial [Humibacillus sp.]|nr:hypothetical protein [Humibacillus sp.]
MIIMRSGLRGAVALLVAATAASAAAVVAPVSAHAAATAATTAPTIGFNGHAYGTTATVASGAVSSGPTALVNIGCTTTAGTVRNAHVAAVSLPALGGVGAVTSSLRTVADTSGRATLTTADV